MKLSGRWGARSGPEQKVAPWSYSVEFTPEGTFSTDGALSHVAAGTYEIRDGTMFFTFADGKTWSTDFSILVLDPKAFTSILFRTTALPRGQEAEAPAPSAPGNAYMHHNKVALRPGMG